MNEDIHQYIEQDAERMIRLGGFMRTRRTVRIWSLCTALSIVVFFCWLDFFLHVTFHQDASTAVGVTFYTVLAFVIPVAISAIQLRKAVEEYRKVFKQSYVLPAMEKVFTDLTYEPFQGIAPRKSFLTSQRFRSGPDRFRGRTSFPPDSRTSDLSSLTL